MQKFSIPFGKGHIHFELPDEQVAGVLLSHAHEYKAPKSEEELVADALANPIGSPRLSELAKGKRRALLFPVTIPVRYRAMSSCHSCWQNCARAIRILILPFGCNRDASSDYS